MLIFNAQMWYLPLNFVDTPLRMQFIWFEEGVSEGGEISVYNFNRKSFHLWIFPNLFGMHCIHRTPEANLYSEI